MSSISTVSARCCHALEKGWLRLAIITKTGIATMTVTINRPNRQLLPEYRLANLKPEIADFISNQHDPLP